MQKRRFRGTQGVGPDRRQERTLRDRLESRGEQRSLNACAQD